MSRVGGLAGRDVLVLGEPLVELSSPEPLRSGSTVRLAFSGDALNAAAAAAAAGARTAVLARVPDDELGDAMADRIAELGIDIGTLVRVPAGQHGVYFTHIDPEGKRQFAYARGGSAGSALSPDDVTEELVASSGVVVASGIASAVSDSAAAAVHRAAKLARRFVYDPNFRPRLTSAAAAGTTLAQLCPLAELVTPSWPEEAGSLLGPGLGYPGEAVARVRELGAAAVALTCGRDGVLLDEGGGAVEVPAVPAERVVDQTGAGDVFTGTVSARLALGDPLAEAVRLGAAAAALSVRGQGGTGYLPTLAETRAAAR